LLVAGRVRGVAAEVSQPNTRSHVEVVKPLIFNRKTRQILGFLTAYRLYIRIRIRKYSSKRASIVYLIIYTGRISRYV